MKPQLRTWLPAASGVLALATLFALAACHPKKKPPESEGAPPPPELASAVPVPPAMPVEAVDAAVGDLDGKSPYEQATELKARGQLWMARLVLEQRALGPEGTKDETLLLANICHEQDDEACVAACAKKVGVKNLKFDGGAPRKEAQGGAPPEHKEPDSDAARARDLVLKMRYEQARRTLEPKVLGGTASKEEIRLLRVACEKQGDRMCVALCDTKLK